MSLFCDLRSSKPTAPTPVGLRGDHDPAAAVSAGGAVRETATGRTRVAGVDVARGLALLGMMAAHIFSIVRDAGSPTATTLVAGGRSAATFALLAGVSLAFLSGGRHCVRGRARRVACAGLLVRALLIGLIGLLLGLTEVVDVVLPFYALMFLLAIPLRPPVPAVRWERGRPVAREWLVSTSREDWRCSA